MTTPQEETNKGKGKGNSAPPPVEMTPPPATQALAEFDYGDDAGQGFENQDMSDRKLPMIMVLQSNSPQVVESKGKVHPGALMNTVTGEIFEELLVVAALTDHAFTLWVPRDDGGGFRGRFPKDAKMVFDAIARNDGRSIGKLPVPQEKDPKTGKPQPTLELVETFEVYGITYKNVTVDGKKSGEVTGFAVIPFTSTKIKSYRGWNTQVSMFAIGGKQIPIFAHKVKITTELEQNAKGSYFVPVLSPAEGGDDLKGSLLAKTDSRYIAAKKLHDDVMKGLAKAAYETMEQEPGIDPEAGVPF